MFALPRWHNQPLAKALLKGLRQEGFAGATVFHGVAGFGARSVLHSPDVLRLSVDLPIVIEVVDSEEYVQRLMPILEEMVPEGLVTLERIQVIKYSPGTRPPDKEPSDGRDPDGRFVPGNTLGTPFGPDKPPPRSLGRPKRDAWVSALEQRLEAEPCLGQPMADRLIKIVLKGNDRAAIQAAQVIQDRVGGPVTQRVEAEIARLGWLSSAGQRCVAESLPA